MTTEPAKTIEDLLKEFGEPDGPMPAPPPWHVDDDDSHSCPHGWIIGGVEWGICDCEDPAHPWPPRVPGDGPRDCVCFGCMDHKPRHERGRIRACEYTDHHCDDCHEHERCTIESCGFGAWKAQP